ncbi:MAG: M48 family metallopeptidase [Bacteroidia bacterium]|nr:M48 family metallopeptidase [Bacteroidia bacterium]
MTKIQSTQRNYYILFSLLLVFFQCQGIGQDHYNFKPLQSSGKIPDDFIYSFSEKYNKKTDSLNQKENSDLELEKSFYEESFYHINQLLNSGKVTFNDPASKYVSEIADILLEEKPEVREKLRFYTVKSSSVNAFTSSEGIILINLGLLSQVKNEAQLAFILCHEISHYIEKHPLDIYINNSEIYSQTQSSNFQKYAYQKALVETNKYSKEKEEEADQLGLQLFLSSKYSLASAVKVFDVLKNEKEPYRNISFSLKDFNSAYLTFSDTSFFGSYADPDPISLKKLPIRGTHPSPIRRQTLIRRKVRKIDNSSRNEFILPASRFHSLQKQCRFELVRQYLLENKYEKAIYLANILLKEHPGHPYLMKEIGFALFGLANYANSGRLWDVHINFEEKNGPENRVNYIFDVLTDEQINLMAILYNWNLLKSYPSPRNQKALETIIFQFGKAFYSKEYLRDIQKNQVFKLGLKKALTENDFVSLFENSLTKNPKKLLMPLDKTDLILDKKKIKLTGYHFGIDQVVFIDPFFQYYDDRKEISNQYFKSEKYQKEFMSMVNQYADKFEIQNQILAPPYIGKENSEKHRQMSLIKLWILERNNHSSLDWVSLYYDDVQELIPVFGTPYIIALGGIGIKQSRKSKNLTLVAGILFLPILPYSLFYNFTPQQDFILYAVIYDLEKDASNSVLSKRVGMKASESNMNSQLYDFFLQLHQKSKD